MKKYIIKYTPFILIIYIIIVAALSLISIPNNNEVELPGSFDKLVHFCFYFGMSILTLTTIWIKHQRIKTISCVKTFIITFTFGFMIEIIQPYFGRTFDLSDIIANCVGNLLGIALILTIYKRYNIF